MCEETVWIQLAYCWAVLNSQTTHVFFKKSVSNFLTSYVTASFSKRGQLHGVRLHFLQNWLCRAEDKRTKLFENNVLTFSGP